ncbi:hypothetical protein BH18VER1_BH18VER1_11030 [soil metagenome]
MKFPIHPSRRNLIATGVAALVAFALPTVAQVPTPPPTNPNLAPDTQGTTGLARPATTGIGTQPTPSPSAASSGAHSAAQPSEAEMMQMMMDNAKLNENHKLLAELVGDWTYTVNMWMDPSAPPIESKGTATRKSEWGGRYFIADASGKFQMPGPEGKMQPFDFKGRSTEGYDNAKKKFVSSWIDNMGTGIMISEGTYDPATKTFTYLGDYDMAPGMKTKIRETIKVTDKDHHLMEWFENRGGQEAKTMEIAYTRAGKK